ncbi:MAG: hypothetical protein ABII18_00190, partial [bacterium]
NNTIDGGQHEDGLAYGLRFSDSNPTIINNLFVTYTDRNQASIYCEGTEPEDEITIENNMFLRYSSNDLLFPAYIACNGNVLDTNSELEASTEVDADDNLVSEVTELSDLANVLDTSDYYKLISGSQTSDATPLSPINNGQDTDDEDVGAVIADILGSGRTLGSYDIGSHEL